jgi:DNA-binding response OmpR family regulator
MNNPFAVVVEDDKDLAVIFAKALEEAAFDVEIFYDGESALERFKCLSPHVVVLDLNLPGMSGNEVLKRIRANRQLEDTKVILATANHLMAQILENEADLVLIKPIMFSQLRDLTGRLRDRK